LPGGSEPLRVYGVRGEGSVASRFEATAAGRTPFVGRDEELGLLLRRWEQAKEGEGQVVLLVGEPGIGKSRLAHTLHERIVDEPHLRVQYQCVPYSTNSAFAPILRQLERAARFLREDTPAQKLDKLEALLASGPVPVPEVAPLLAALLALPTGDRYPPLTLSPQRQKARTLEALVDQFVGRSRQQPIVCLCEDAHWSDPSSLELLDLLVDRVPALRVLVVITYRPEFASRWGGYAHVTTQTLTRLTRREGVALVAAVTGGKVLPLAVLEQIVAKTDGVPLFVEELTKTVLESPFLVDQGDHYALAGSLLPLAIPATLQDALLARLDRLAAVKEVAQVGAVLGREFAYELLAAVSLFRDEALQDALDQLVHAGLLFRRGTPPEASYRFKHALVQDAAYESLLRRTRRQYHQQIAQVLEERFPDTTETQPELLAHHYTEAGCTAQAMPYWQRAGQRASECSAYVEAMAHCTKGLELLQTLPDTPARAQHELLLHMTLRVPLVATKGYGAPEVERALTRARELCQQVGETSLLFEVLAGLSVLYNVRAEMQKARELGEQCLTLAKRVDNSAYLARAHNVLGMALFFSGALTLARTHLEQVIALDVLLQSRFQAFPRLVVDGRVSALTHAALALWLLGYPDQAATRNNEALTLAQAQSYPQSLAYALHYAAAFHLFRREAQAAQARAEAAIALSTEHGFMMWLAAGTVARGWALAAQGQGEAGIAQIRQGLAAWQATGTANAQSVVLAVLAEAYGQVEQTEEGLRVLTEALTVVDKTGECVYAAELYRLKGVLTLRQCPVARATGHAPIPQPLPPCSQAEVEAEAYFQQAIEIARRQRAKSLELRAVMSLSRLWQQQGKCQEAHNLLAPVYDWFTEGFDTADLQEAKTLLEELTGAGHASQDGVG
jgi:predicted ATPase